eukprot:NODE_64_length_26047_cov_1.706837.p6 type:complete len:422 gc:universal NODE_64_length_26047_cov_1.706837:15953-17218(+)
MLCNEPIQIFKYDDSSFQNIKYREDGIDKYIGKETDASQESYGLAILQHEDVSIGCYTINEYIYIFDPKSGLVSNFIQLPKNAEGKEVLYTVEFAIIEEELFIAAGGWYGSIYIINLNDATNYVVLEQHGGPIHCIQTNPQYPHIIASCSADRTVKVWDLKHFVKNNPKDMDSIITFAGVGGHKMQVNTICWNPVGDKIASGGYDLMICMWDIPIELVEIWSGNPYKENYVFEIYPLLIQNPGWSTMMLHTSAIDDILWLSTCLLSKAADGEIICWKKDEREEIEFNIDVARLNPVEIILRMTFESDTTWFIRFGYCRRNCHAVCGNSSGSLFFWNLEDLLINREREFLSKKIIFENFDIADMRDTYNNHCKRISYDPGLGFNYSYKYLNSNWRNFAFTIDGSYCYALNDSGILIRINSEC